MPAHGVFVENRLKAFLERHDADVRVVAPTPWFPFKAEVFGRYGQWAKAPRHETRFGVPIWRPQYFLAPKLGMHMAPAALEHCLERTLKKFGEDGWYPDFIDAHYFYPDGVAAVNVGRKADIPVIVTARGTDVNLIPKYETPRNRIIASAKAADAIITVAGALKDELVSLGVDGEKINVFPNGVDLEMFKLKDRNDARQAIGLGEIDGPILASVGHLIERKGHHLAIDALQKIDGAHLVIAGTGVEEKNLRTQVQTLGLDERVHFLGQIDHASLSDVYNAADLLILASSREGWPNVLLEAMACGSPCVATPVWGTREVIRTPAAGALSADRSANAIADAVNIVLKNPPTRSDTRAFAEQHSWASTADSMAALFSDFSKKSAVAKSMNVAPMGTLKVAQKKPKLIVTIDTEEQFDWSTFDGDSDHANDVRDIERFQNMCAQTGVTPLYFLTHPMLHKTQMAEFFRSIVTKGEASAGLHLHQWVTPPKTVNGEHHSFQKNLPRSLHLEKLHTLAAKFEAQIGKSAIAHRAGRYGIAQSDYDLLARIGIQFDFSPSSAFNYEATGGPNFSGMSNLPFVISKDAWQIAVTPVCGAKAIKKTSHILNQNYASPGFHQQTHSSSFVVPIRLSPEGLDLKTLKALTESLIKTNTPVLSFTFHSTSLTPGANPYSKTPNDVEQLLQTSQDYFNWFRDDCDGEIISLPELQELYQGDLHPRS